MSYTDLIREAKETVVKQLNSFAEANEYLTRFYHNIRVTYSLDNIRELMTYLDNPQDAFKVVHVAGTSGKTSTAYYMSALLTAAGRKTGLTVSPHIDEINERVQINGQPLPEAVFCQALTEFLRLVEDGPVKPSWFEVMIAFAYWYFAREKVDYAVIEVGLGGLLDGTNVITRPDKVCIMTDIGRDHMHVLGNTIAEIAAQKIGIVQPDNRVFSYDQGGEIMAVFKERIAQQKAVLTIVDEQAESDQFGEAAEQVPGYQLRNWLLAFHAYDFIEQRDSLPHVSRQPLEKTQQILIPGRMEIRKINDKTIIMDGAHNAQKITALVDSFTSRYPRTKPAVLIALRSGKEYPEVAALLSKLAARIIVTTFEATQDVPVKSMDPEELARAFREAGAQQVENIPDHRQAFQALLQVPESICIVTGSFYLLSQIRNNGT